MLSLWCCAVYVAHNSLYVALYLGNPLGNKFTITTTHILLMAVVILLLTMLLEAGEKPKRMVVVDKKKTGEKSE